MTDSPTALDAPDDSAGARRWPAVTNRPSFPTIEEDILALWGDLDVFHASLRARADAPVWTFYEGPPTANGKPGTHHVEARTFKDVFPRYRTMKGYLVPRKGGWDCHGLPVELAIEKELGLNSKKEIEEFGIEAFNQRCRESVTRYVGDWEKLTERIGFWVDLDDAYRTMDTSYVESLWWGLKTLWEKGLIFEAHRVTPYCGRCGTGLSDAEVAQGYQTVEDPSVYVRFPLTEGPLAERGASLVVWTTTPWTLPSNTAVAVGADVTYELVEADGQLLIIAAELREKVLGEDAVVIEPVAAADLVGLHYDAPITILEPTEGEDWRYIVTADFVTTTDGSGLVHLAPAFGADDMAVGKAHGLPVINPVDLEAKFAVGPWAGQFVKDADPAITEALRASGRLLKAEMYTHTYPFCWRCQRPLIYFAKPSWYIQTTAKRDQLIANNAEIDWHPGHIREGRFGNWLENNVDWALSRDRYWGTPLPFWRCEDCDHVTVVGSRAELGELAGVDTTDLDPHRPYVDEITLPCPECSGTARRVAHVADAWFDSGGMPYAQWGYPHQGKEEFERHFPAQFISEAIDQTRGWFYTLLAESTLLFDTSAYETVLCLGHIVDEDGAKMSKSKGNILDPWELIDQHGADALRWVMLAEGTPWVNRRVGHGVLEDVVRRFLLTLWNTHYFFATYAELDGFDPGQPVLPVADRPLMDRWVLAELADLVDAVDAGLEAFDVGTAGRRLEGFVDDLSNWYVRRSRRRFWKAGLAGDPGDAAADKAAAYATLHTCLSTLSGLLAPFMPFLAEQLWQDLVTSQDAEAAPSVHLTDFPVVDEAWRDDELRRGMISVRQVVELGRQARNDSGVKVRQPLGRALVTVPSDQRDALRPLLAEVAEELNVKVVDFSDGSSDLVDRTLKPDFRALGPAFGKQAPVVAKALQTLDAATAATVAAALLADGMADVEVDGATIRIASEMVAIVETPRTGWALAKDAGASFALDTTLDDDLLLEGAARELVRALNDQRKALDLALDDRITATVSCEPADLLGRLEAAGHLTFVAGEVLADAIEQVRADDAITVDLGDLGTAFVSVVA